MTRTEARIHDATEPQPPTSTLALRLGARRGVTRLLTSWHEFPQRLTVPMYLDEPHPGPAPAMAYLCIQNPTAGLFRDDRLLTSLVAEEDARIHLTSQAATQVFSAPGDAAGPPRHTFELVLGPRSVVELVGRRITPHADAALVQRTEVTMAEDAVFIGWESVAAGRVGHGERHRYRFVDLTTEVRVGGETVALDAARLEPTVHNADSQGVLAGHDYVSSLTVAAPGLDSRRLALALADAIDAVLPATDGVAGVGLLPGGAGLCARILTTSAPAADRVRDVARTTVRELLIGLPTPAGRW